MSLPIVTTFDISTALRGWRIFVGDRQVAWRSYRPSLDAVDLDVHGVTARLSDEHALVRGRSGPRPA
jgi:hypothetical protein